MMLDKGTENDIFCIILREGNASMKRLLSAVLTLAMVLSMVAGMGMTISAAEPTVITQVELLNVPTATVGGTATTEGLSVPEGAPYALYVEGWGVYQGEQAVVFSGTFEAGNRYVLMFVLDPHDGYEFAEDVAVPEGAAARILDTGVLELRYEFDLPGYEDSVDIVGIPKVVSGETITTDGIAVAEGDHAVIGQDTVWQVLDGSNWTNVDNGGAFISGKKYRVSLQIVAEDGWQFADGLTVTVDGKTNGEVSGDIGEKSLTYTTDEMEAPLTRIYSVEINYDLPAVGAAPSEFAVPEGANYIVADSEWIDMDTRESVTAFEDGRKYQMHVTLIPMDGFVFYNDRVWVNGEEYFADYNAEHSVLSLSCYYHFCEKLTMADVICTKPEVGKKMPIPTIPEGANYSIVEYSWNGTKGSDEIAFAGDQYELEVTLKGNQGYIFDKYANITINGGVPSSSYVNNPEDAAGNGTAVVSEVFDLRTPIDKVEISFATPEIGKEPPEVTIANKEQYKYWSVEWMSAIGNESITDPFQEGKSYRLEITLTNWDYGDYCFSEETEFYVNGELFVGTINEGWAFVTYRVDFGEMISAVDFPSWEEYEIGDTIPEDIAITSDDGSYTIYARMYRWSDMFGEFSIFARGLFEDGGIYQYEIVAVPNEGYMFAENTIVTQKGSEPVGRVPSNPYGSGEIMLVNQYSFRDVKIVDHIELTVDGIEIGRVPGHIFTPEDADYSCFGNSAWRVCKNGNYDSQKVLKEPLQEGDCAIVHIYLWGHIIDLGAKVTVNGKEAQVMSAVRNNKGAYEFTIMLDPLTSNPPEETEPTEGTQETTVATEETTESTEETTETTEGTTATTTPKDPEVPSTGDDSHIHILTILMLISVCGMCVVVFAGKKYKGV